VAQAYLTITSCPLKICGPHGIPVIMYDQLGCGNSTHLQEKNGDGTFWTISLFLSELDNLLRHLGIQDEYYLLGQYVIGEQECLI
jgi:pimeloyl-ACP methyl ester carboxylesterase